MGEWTVAVVGGGPAGASAALAVLAVEPSARVLLLDRCRFPRDKACGDGVAPHVIVALSELGLGDLYDDYEPALQLEMGTGSATAVHEVRCPLRAVPRAVFDARLVEAALERGAVLRQQAVRSVVVADDHVVIDGDVTADVVVGADGVESVVRRQLGIAPNRDGHMAVAIRGYTPSLASRARLVARGRDWPAYAWEFPIGDGRSNVGYGEVLRPGKVLTRSTLLERLEELLPGATRRATEWKAARIPLATWRPRQPPGRVLLAGDAASLVNPMSGEGIWYAVRSGILAGRASLHGAGAGNVYAADLRREFSRHLRHANAMATLGRYGSLSALGTRMTVVDEAFFHNQVDVSIAGGTYKPTVFARALVRAVVGRGGVLRGAAGRPTSSRAAG